MAQHVELASAYMSIIPSLRGGGDQLRGQITGAIGAGVGAAIGMKIAQGIGSVINVAKDIITTGIDEAKDASAGIAQLEAGIQSTGGAAGVTVAEMVALAGSIQGYSGQTDDSIVKTQGLLLTFTNIKNSGADKIFDRATVAAADMAAKFGGEASGQAKVLGKALNDPVAGLAALTRVGVQFTDGQKESIKAMVASGDTIGAQNIILGELETKFGGAAKAAGESLPGQIERGKRAFEDLSQSVVETFLPAVTPVIEQLPGMFQAVAPLVQGLATGLMAAFTAIWSGGQKVIAFFSEYQGVAIALAVVVGALTVAYAANAAIMAVQAAGGLAAYIAQIGIVRAATSLWAAVQWVLNGAFLASPITWIIIGIVALIAAIVLLVQNWDQVVAFVTQIWGGFVNWLMGIMGAVAAWWSGVWSGILGFFSDTWNNILTFVQISILAFQLVISTGMQLAQSIISNVLNGISNFFTSIWNGIVNFVMGSAQMIATVIMVGLNLAQSYVSNGLNNVANFFRNIWNGIVGFVSGVLGTIGGVVSGGVNALSGIASGALAAVAGVFSGAWNGIIQGVSNSIGSITGFFSGLGGKILGAIGNVGGLLAGIGSSIITSLYNGLVSSWGKVTDFVGGIAGWIAANKGPESLDRVLLRPAGQWIMGGLADSMTDEIPTLEGSLGRVTATIANYRGAAIRTDGMFDTVKPGTVSSLGDQVAAAGAGAKGPAVHYHGDVYGFDPETAPREWERKLQDASAVAGLRNDERVL